jgi:endonuclease G
MYGEFNDIISVIEMKYRNYFFTILCLSVGLRSCKQNNAADFESFEKGSKVEQTSKDFDKAVASRSKLDLAPTSTTNQIIQHTYYTLSYNEEYEQAEWVAYELKKENLKNNDFKRPYFIEDNKVSTGSADWRNYKKSGYDKGHLVPAADMEFNQYSYNDTFLTSNISPQDHDFNAGIWNRLEQKVRFWAEKYNGVYVVTGGVLEPSLQTIGKDHVAVPKEFYKIILYRSGSNYKMIAFLMPNKASNKALFDYAVPVDLIEKKTGIDFFPALDDAIENKLERAVNMQPWFAR